MPIEFSALTRDALDHQLSPSRHAKDFLGVLMRHEAETAALWSDPGISTQRDLRYGPAPRALLDLVRPHGPGPFPCLMVVHGGFWQEGSKAGSGFAAQALAKLGWATALVGYTLAPEARLGEIVAEIGAAVRFLSRSAETLQLDRSRLVIAGHSAGGHMAAAVVCGKAGDDVAALLAGAVLVSGVYDLAPIAASYVNDVVGMDAAEVAALSVLEERPLRDIPIHVVVGADEPAAFLDQSAALQAQWSQQLTALTMRRAPGRDHFDVLDELADPGSPSFAAIREMQA